MKKTISYLGILILLLYMLVERMGTSRVWIAVGLLCCWALLAGADIFRNRGQVAGFVGEALRFRFSVGKVRFGKRKENDAEAPGGPADRVARGILCLLAVGMIVAAGFGVGFYALAGIARHPGVDTAMGVMGLAFVAVSLFLSRRKIREKIRNFMGR